MSGDGYDLVVIGGGPGGYVASSRAAQLGYRALAVTDVHSLAGVVRAHVAAAQVELPLVVGIVLDAPAVLHPYEAGTWGPAVTNEALRLWTEEWTMR